MSRYKHPERGMLPDYPFVYTIDELLAGRDKEIELALSLARAELSTQVELVTQGWLVRTEPVIASSCA